MQRVPNEYQKRHTLCEESVKTIYATSRVKHLNFFSYEYNMDFSEYGIFLWVQLFHSVTKVWIPNGDIKTCLHIFTANMDFNTSAQLQRSKTFLKLSKPMALR